MPILAESAPRVSSIAKKNVFTGKDKNGRSVLCARINNKNLYIIKEGAGYITSKEAISNLVTEISNAAPTKVSELEEQLAELRVTVRKRGNICKVTNGGSSSMKKLSRPLQKSDVANLLNKAGFGLSEDEEQLLEIAQDSGVVALVNAFMETKNEPDGLIDRVLDRRDGNIGSSTSQSPSGQRAAIVDLWIHTNNPFAEKLAMILLSIWTVSGEVIEDETFRSAWWDYYQKLRDAAYSQVDLPELGLDITTDPLMLIFLNNDLNIKDNPNENYARELMELFTLGPTNLNGRPNYTESVLGGTGDIAVAAKMLTGWSTRKDYTINQLVAEYDSNDHEDGIHTMFEGKPYEFSGEDYEDLVRGIFNNHPEVKNYYAKELLKHYLTPNPTPELIKAFGLIIKKYNYRLRPALKTLFMSDAFYDSAYRDTVPCDPLEMAAKVTRILGLKNGINQNEVAQQIFKVGYVPNLPPSVFWYPHDAWIGSTAALEKANLIAQLFGDSTSLNNIAWTPQSILPVGAVTLPQLVEHVRQKLGLNPLNAAQKDAITSYLTSERQYDDTYLPFTYDNTNTTHQRRKGLGLYYLLLLSQDFQLN